MSGPGGAGKLTDMDQLNRDRPVEQPISHQNVKLQKGRHANPSQGACVVEIASMLAEEDFSDRPRSVCPMLAAYMRAVNDLAGDEDRQRLLPYAAALVGTSGNRRAMRGRIAACARWSRQLGEVSALRAALLRWGGGLDTLGTTCARAALREGFPLALAFADCLIGAGGEPAAEEAYPAASPGVSATASGGLRVEG